MGLFSSKYKTYVGVSASRVIPDEMAPDSIQAGTLRSILKSADMPLTIIEELNRGLGNRVRSMYQFGKNQYTFGTPEPTIYSTSVGQAEITAVLQSLHPGAEIAVQYHHLGVANILHIGWMKLVSEHGYNPQTNLLGALTASTGTSVYLDDLVVVLPAATAASYEGHTIDQWGTPPKSRPSPTRPALETAPALAALQQFTPVNTAGTLAYDYARADWAYKGTGTTIVKGSINLTNDEFGDSTDYFQVGYLADGVQKFWLYEAGTGTHPTLDALADAAAEGSANGSFLPFVHFRHGKQSMAIDQGSQAFLQSVKMLKKLGTDYMEMHDAIHENPDIGDVANAYLGFFVNPKSAHQEEKRYLFDFFERLQEAGFATQSAASVGLQGWVSDGKQFTLLIEDKKVKHGLTMSWISRRMVAGTLADGLEYASGYVTGGQLGSHHYFRKQVTPHVYDEILVGDLTMRYWVQGDYTATGNAEEDVMLIPIDYAIARGYPMKVQEKLYARGMHLVCTSIVTVKIKWYQTGFFSTLLQVIGIILAFWDGGFTFSALQSGTLAVAAALTYIVVTLIVTVVVQFGFKLLVKEIGGDAALALAAIAAAYGFTVGLEQGFAAALPTIQTMLDIAINLVQATTSLVMDDLLEVGRQFDTFYQEVEQKTELLEETRKLLENSTRLNPMVIFGESPDAFYNRTVHSGNVGVHLYSTIESYVDMALTLPTLANTLGSPE